jgi:hypothetical protein
MRRISELDEKGPQLIERKLKLLTVQQDQITKLLEKLSSEEINTAFAWTLGQIDDVNASSEGFRPLTVYLRKVLVAVSEPYPRERYATQPIPTQPVPNILPATQPVPNTMRAMPVRIPPEPKIPELNSTTRKGDIPSILRPNVAFDAKEKQNTRGNVRADSPDFFAGKKRRESVNRSGTYSKPKKYERKQPKQSRSGPKPIDDMNRWASDDPDDSGSGVWIEPSSWSSSSSEDSYGRRGASRNKKKERRLSSAERLPIPHLEGTRFPAYPPYGYPSGVAAPYSGMYSPYPGILPQGPYAYPSLIPQGYAPPVAPFYGSTSYPSVPPYNNPLNFAHNYGPTPYPRTSPAPPFAPDVPYSRDNVKPLDPFPQPGPAEPTRLQNRGSASHLNAQIARNSRTTNRAPPGQALAGETNKQLPALSSPVYTANKRSYLGAPSSYIGSSYPQYESAELAVPPQRPRVPYPKYYDDRAYNPLDLTTEEPDTNDIVQKLLMDWTPAGDEYREKSVKAKASEAGNASFFSSR